MMPRILAFAGSLRRESFNKKLVPIAARAAREAGALVTQIDLRDFPLPLFDQDLEAEHGMPETARSSNNSSSTTAACSLPARSITAPSRRS